LNSSREYDTHANIYFGHTPQYAFEGTPQRGIIMNDEDALETFRALFPNFLPSNLPRNLRNETIRKAPYNRLPPLIHTQNPDCKRKRIKPKLHRNLRRPKETLNPRDFRDKNRNGETDQSAQNQPWIASCFAEWVCDKNAQPLIPNREDVSPLQDDECDEIHGLSNSIEMHELLFSIAVKPFRVGFEGEEEAGDGDVGVLPHVEEEH